MASCGGAVAFVGLDPFSLADLQATGPLWTPPPLPEVPAVAEAPANETAGEEPSGSEASRFQPGVQARNVTSTRVNIRQEPGYLSKPASDVIAQMEAGDTVEIIGWPRNADGLVWWPIRFGTTEGWVAEATASGVQILAPIP